MAYGVALVAAVVYAFVTMRGPHGIAAWMDQRQEIRQLEEENATLARENQLKRQYLDRLARRPATSRSQSGGASSNC